MPSFVLRKISSPLWRRFKARADKAGQPLRWVLLQLIDDYASGRYHPSVIRPPEFGPEDDPAPDPTTGEVPGPTLHERIRGPRPAGSTDAAGRSRWEI